jgi:predicted ATPase
MPGEAGIGKTRLLLEVQTQARRRGVQAGLGRCYEDLTLPYLPFVGAWRTLLEQVPPEVTRALGSDLEVIRRLVPQDTTPTSAGHPLTAAKAGQDTLELFLGVSRATIKLAQHCPTLFIVDDLHWADRSSLDLFGHLVFTVADMAGREPVPLLIVATYRPPEVETRVARLIARLEREKLCQTIALPGLDESEVRQLIRGLGLAPVPSVNGHGQCRHARKSLVHPGGAASPSQARCAPAARWVSGHHNRAGGSPPAGTCHGCSHPPHSGAQ